MRQVYFFDMISGHFSGGQFEVSNYQAIMLRMLDKYSSWAEISIFLGSVEICLPKYYLTKEILFWKDKNFWRVWNTDF